MSIRKILYLLEKDNMIICSGYSPIGYINFVIKGRLWQYNVTDGAIALDLYKKSDRAPGKALNIAKKLAPEYKRPGMDKWEPNPDFKKR